MNCDKDIHEEVKKSMEIPFTSLNRRIVLRPLYSTKADSQLAHRPGHDRRAKGLLKRAKRVYWHYSDDIGFFLWIIVGFMVAVMAWGAFVGFEKWLQ